MSILCGCGFDTHASETIPPAAPKVRANNTFAHVGAEINYRNQSFMPPHRSGESSIRLSWDLLTRRVRYLLDNNVFVRRLVDKLTELTVGEGVTVYSAAIDHLPFEVFESGEILEDPLFAFGDESDAIWDWWVDRYADVERRKTLTELQRESARDLFGTGNTLWLECRKRTPNAEAEICWQLLEAEQLDKTQDRQAIAATVGKSAQNAISNGIEYDATGEPVAYWLYDVHPYDDSFPPSGVFGSGSRRVPAARVLHLSLTSRPSAKFGTALANLILQTTRDTDWLIGHELTSAAIAAGLTILIREGNTGGGVDFDTEQSNDVLDSQKDTAGLPRLSEVGLTAGSAAKVGPGENVEVVESKRPNREVAPFVKFLSNMMSLSGNLSYHRFLGNPEGSSFAVLRAMINDDRAMAAPLTRMLGLRIGSGIRGRHDRLTAGSRGYRTVTPQEYLRRLPVYQTFEVLGPPLRHLNPNEDIDAAMKRIRCGLSTLRIECGLLNLNYRRVLRQLAVEANLTRSMHLVLDFSSGGGMTPKQTTTDGTEKTAAENRSDASDSDK